MGAREVKIFCTQGAGLLKMAGGGSADVSRAGGRRAAAPVVRRAARPWFGVSRLLVGIPVVGEPPLLGARRRDASARHDAVGVSPAAGGRTDNRPVS